MLSSGALGIPNLGTVFFIPLPLLSCSWPADDRESKSGFPRTLNPTLINVTLEGNERLKLAGHYSIVQISNLVCSEPITGHQSRISKLSGFPASG